MLLVVFKNSFEWSLLASVLEMLKSIFEDVGVFFSVLRTRYVVVNASI